MNTFKKICAVAATVGLMVVAPLASALTLSVSNPTFSTGNNSGYGQDSWITNTLLDVQFNNGTAAAQALTLTALNPVTTFSFGSVNLQEINIGSNETNSLGVTASLKLIDPLGILKTILFTGTGTAYVGDVDDSSWDLIGPWYNPKYVYVPDTTVDYKLTWNPVIVNFGIGGQLSFDLNDLSFIDAGLQTLNGTITLVSPSQVPEPTTVALLGLGMLGFAASRRKLGKSKNV